MSGLSSAVQVTVRFKKPYVVSLSFCNTFTTSLLTILIYGPQTIRPCVAIDALKYLSGGDVLKERVDNLIEIVVLQYQIIQDNGTYITLKGRQILVQHNYITPVSKLKGVFHPSPSASK